MSSRWIGDFSEQDKQALTLLRTGQADAIVAGDQAAYAALCADDIQLLIPGKDLLEGSGAAEVARFFVTIFSRFRDKGTTLRIQPQRFNGSLGILIFENGTLATALTIEADRNRISHVYAVRNPDKFSGLPASRLG